MPGRRGTVRSWLAITISGRSVLTYKGRRSAVHSNTPPVIKLMQNTVASPRQVQLLPLRSARCLPLTSRCWKPLLDISAQTLISWPSMRCVEGAVQVLAVVQVVRLGSSDLRSGSIRLHAEIRTCSQTQADDLPYTCSWKNVDDPSRGQHLSTRHPPATPRLSWSVWSLAVPSQRLQAVLCKERKLSGLVSSA
jgi:hypothetical protein